MQFSLCTLSAVGTCTYFLQQLLPAVHFTNRNDGCISVHKPCHTTDIYSAEVLYWLQIHALFEWLVDPCIAFVRRNCKEVVPTADVNLPVSLMNLLSSLLDGFRPDASGQSPVCYLTSFTLLYSPAGSLY